MDRVYAFLFSRFEGTKKKKQAAAMIDFIKGFKARRDKVWHTAINHLNSALANISGLSNSQRQRAAIFTELCYVYMEKTIPDYRQAKMFAEKAHHEIDVTHTLNAYIKARILYSLKDSDWPTRSALDREVEAIRGLIENLSNRLRGTSFTFHKERSDELWKEYSARNEKQN